MDGEVISVVLLGDNRCGKTTFISRVSSKDKSGDFTIFRDMDQPFVFELNQGPRRFRLEFRDSSGPENWQTQDPDMVILCYDVSQRLSLINMKRFWIKDAKKAYDNRDTLPFLILGLKRDLRSEDDPNGIIYPQEGYRVAQELRADKYMECSAATGELVDLAFEEICKTALSTRTAVGGQSEGGCIVL
ncbi:hypothetical protein jhhlp_004370 [Lomentospora prolificans]|uniref:Uncharacterized protein n=1 Tax=Lomentospora prolificans TaxID=41688 RepID=A0A2N3NBE1_9PEZI|nr:hypothetical protein jhhlp_004370 [Lomentospora prolificans]